MAYVVVIAFIILIASSYFIFTFIFKIIPRVLMSIANSIADFFTLITDPSLYHERKMFLLQEIKETAMPLIVAADDPTTFPESIDNMYKQFERIKQIDSDPAHTIL